MDKWRVDWNKNKRREKNWSYHSEIKTALRKLTYVVPIDETYFLPELDNLHDLLSVEPESTHPKPGTFMTVPVK